MSHRSSSSRVSRAGASARCWRWNGGTSTFRPGKCGSIRHDEERERAHVPVHRASPTRAGGAAGSGRCAERCREQLPFLVFNRNGKPIADFREAWAQATVKAGCPGRLVHDLRRTAVRTSTRAGVPKSIAMKMTGHKTDSVFRRYDIASPDDLRVAADALNAAARKADRVMSGTERGAGIMSFGTSF